MACPPTAFFFFSTGQLMIQEYCPEPSFSFAGIGDAAGDLAPLQACASPHSQKRKKKERKHKLKNKYYVETQGNAQVWSFFLWPS